MARVYPLVIKRTSGVNVWDVDDNRYLDMNSGIAVMNLGHAHPNITDAIKKQAELGTHAAYLEFYSELPVKFIEELLTFTPSFQRAFLTNSGAESIEAAMKLARYHTKRKYFMAFYGSFHGRTLGALSLSASKVVHRKNFGPFYPVVHAPYCDPSHCLLNHSEHQNGADCAKAHLDYIEDVIFQREVAPGEIAAMFVEPIQGEGGYVVPPREFLQGLRKICDRYGILYVDDEVQAGYYRTGKFLAIEHFNLKPDIVCLAKALGGGVPLGAILSTNEVMDWQAGSHATTFGGNLLACAAGLAGLKTLRKLDLGPSILEKGNWAMNYLGNVRNEKTRLRDVRGLGLMIGVEMGDGKNGHSSAQARDSIIQHCFERGVCYLPAGDSTIRIAPPLIISKPDLAYGIEILGVGIRRYL